MIDMKVVRRVKVVPAVNAKLKDKVEANTLREVYQRLADEYGKEIESLRNELTFAHQENERLRATLTVEKKKCNEAYDLAIKASADLGTRLAKTLDERDEAREEVDDLAVALMDRECRIDELTRRVKFLEAALADGEIVN